MKPYNLSIYEEYWFLSYIDHMTIDNYGNWIGYNLNANTASLLYFYESDSCEDFYHG